MWFDVDWNSLSQSIMPGWWRRSRFVTFVRVLISQVMAKHVEFKQTREQLIYDMTVTGQTMSLESALNDRFDDVDRGIYIDNQVDPTQLYIYRKVEAQPPLYIYRKWLITTNYGVGQFAQHKGRVWKCLVANIGFEPVDGSFRWQNYAAPIILRRKEVSQLSWDFKVFVPSAVTFDEQEMRALIDRYRLAGKRYTIIIF